MKRTVFACLAALSLVGCGGQGPVSEDADNVGTPAENRMLPPDENVATPTNNLETEATDLPPARGTGKIPVSLHGRWGMTPSDCTSTRGDAKGLMIVSGDGLKFYESVAKPAGELKTSGNSASGDFTFTGEGMTWKKYEALELQSNKLVRTESSPMESFTYVRCPG